MSTPVGTDASRRSALAAIGNPPVTVPLDRILIVMMSAVGDVVHVMPVVHALKAHAPAAHITWVLQPGPATLVRGHPLVDDIVLFDRSRGWRAFQDIRRELSSRRFDVALALQVYLKAGLITSFAHARVKLGFDRARARDANWLFTTHRLAPRAGQHVQDQYFEFLDALGVPHGAPAWTLGPWNEEERAWQRSFLAGFDRPIAPIVVATSKADKDWMPERWAAVCQILWIEFGLQPVLVGGRSEREIAAEAIILREAPMAHSALGSGLRKLSAILDGAAVALSPDTGPLHLAVALRTPVISLLGYTNPKRVGPYDYSRDLMIDEYGEPGEDYPLDMTYRHNRMSRITVEQVREKLLRWKKRYKTARLEELSDVRRGT
jgi:heptosyltransferase I